MAEGRHYPRMNGKQVFARQPSKMPEVAREALDKLGLDHRRHRSFVPHQANMRINQHVAKELGSPTRKWCTTSTATEIHRRHIPIGISEACRDGRIEKGSTVLFAAFRRWITGAFGRPVLGRALASGEIASPSLGRVSTRDFQLNLARRAGGFCPIGAANPRVPSSAIPRANASLPSITMVRPTRASRRRNRVPRRRLSPRVSIAIRAARLAARSTKISPRSGATARRSQRGGPRAQLSGIRWCGR